MVKLKQITLKNIYHYITGNIRYQIFKYKSKKISYINQTDWIDGMNNTKLSFYQEQFLYRIALTSKLSPKCLENKSCRICSCSVPEMMFADKVCEGDCYPPLMEERAWERYKIEYKVDMLEIYKIAKPHLK